MNPEDLSPLECHEVAEKLFGRAPSPDDWWSLEKVSDTRFLLNDARLRIGLRVSAGFLVALHEVSNYQHAHDFARKNSIRVMQDRGIFLRSTSEIAIKCDGVPPMLPVGRERYKIEFADGVEATVAHASFLFQRLVALPSAESNLTLPEPSVLTTLVMTGVDIDNVTDVAERSLYALRDHLPDASFEFVPLSAQSVLGDSLEDVFDEPQALETTFATAHPWAIAFFNRATESEPLAAFLYYYRVLEACFDLVIEKKLNAWRSNSSLDATELLREVRSLVRTEDMFALRQVLGQIVEQSMLDEALEASILDVASIDDLTTKIYLRRNEIAHGRRGQHQKVLVPYSFPLNASADRDMHWQKVMRSLARKAIGHLLQA